jgi:ATP-dependent DNA ligase
LHLKHEFAGEEKGGGYRCSLHLMDQDFKLWKREEEDDIKILWE